MCEQTRLLSCNACEPVTGSASMPLKTLMLARQPQHEFAIDLPQRGVQCRLVECTVIIYPPSDLGVEHMRQVKQGLVTAILQIPVSDLLTYCFPCLGTHRRTEVDEGFTPSILRQSRPKRIAQKVKARVGVIPPPISILAVDHSGLQRMQFQSTLREPHAQGTNQCFGLRLTATVAHNIIGVPFKGYTAKLTLHPHIKDVVQE